MLTTILCPSSDDAWRVSMTTLGILLSVATNKCLVLFEMTRRAMIIITFSVVPLFYSIVE